MNTETCFNYLHLDTLVAQDALFFIYRHPAYEELILATFKPTDLDYYNNLRALNAKEGFVMAPFTPTENHPVILMQHPVITTGEAAIFQYLESYLNLDPAHDSRTLSSDKSAHSTMETYRSTFDYFLSELKKGRCDKVVLSRAVSTPKPIAFSPGKTFRAACEAYPEAFVYLCHNPVAGTWLGSSPEVLLSGDGSKWKTVAMAGTMKESANSGYFDWDDKNIDEQHIVTVYIEDVLRSLKLDYSKTGPSPSKAGKLVHLKTNFSFQMENSQLGELLDKLHPTPAVCGFPKERALQLITENEGFDRAYYSGFIGPLSFEGKTALHVNLRCLSVGADYLTLYAGGGLLPSSTYEAEWEETEAKLQTMRFLIDH